MDKKAIVEHIQAHLADELAGILKSAEAAYEAATHPESRAEDSHDTRGLEASYLASAQAQRAGEIKRMLMMYKFLPVRDYGPEDVIVPSALVEMELNGTRAFYFVVPQGGGFITRIDGQPIQVITPQSPIGEAMLGKKAGDKVEVEMKNSVRNYKVVSVR